VQKEKGAQVGVRWTIPKPVARVGQLGGKVGGAGACWTGSNGLWVHGLGRQGEFATEAKERGELAPNCLGQLGP
jgi:hypothetical protein